jgi:peroxiredoxin
MASVKRTKIIQRGSAVALAAAILLGALVLSGPVLAEDNKAADFTLPNLKGEDVTLSDLLAGGPVIVDFWATWCRPCIQSFPDLQKLVDEYKDRGLTVVAVSVDGPRTRSRVEPFIRSKDYGFEVLFDTQGRVAQRYSAVAIPRTVLVNSDGEIALATVGYRPSNHDLIEKALVPLLRPEHAKGGETAK